MCTPAAISLTTTALASVGTIFTGISEYSAQAQIQKYQRQLAINNAKNARNEAAKLRQQGIEKAREEKIEGLKTADRLAAINSSNGFDIASKTNLENYEDIYNSAASSSQNTLDSYNDKADVYISKANNFLNTYNNQAADYNSKLYSKALNSLNSANKVAKGWYNTFNSLSNEDI